MPKESHTVYATAKRGAELIELERDAMRACIKRDRIDAARQVNPKNWPHAVFFVGDKLCEDPQIEAYGHAVISITNKLGLSGVEMALPMGPRPFVRCSLKYPVNWLLPSESFAIPAWRRSTLESDARKVKRAMAAEGVAVEFVCRLVFSGELCRIWRTA